MIPDEEDPIIPTPEEEEEEVVDDLDETAPAVDPALLPEKVPVDPATGEEYKSGEVPPGWNQPVP